MNVLENFAFVQPFYNDNPSDRCEYRSKHLTLQKLQEHYPCSLNFLNLRCFVFINRIHSRREANKGAFLQLWAHQNILNPLAAGRGGLPRVVNVGEVFMKQGE